MLVFHWPITFQELAFFFGIDIKYYLSKNERSCADGYFVLNYSGQFNNLFIFYTSILSKQILVDCERMRYPDTGLFHYCARLGEALLEEANDAEKFNFFMPAAKAGYFGNKPNYVNQYAYQKLILPFTAPFNLWHATHQGTNYFPHKSKIPIVLTVHDINFMHDPEKTEVKKKKYLRNLTAKIQRADKIVFISKFVQQDILQYISVENEKCEVIYNGCSVQHLSNLMTPLIAPKEQYLFALGLVSAKKNFHVLPCLLKNNNLKLVIGGAIDDKAYHQKIIDEAVKLGVTDRLIFTGSLSENDKQWFYENCYSFLFPSLAEGFGMPVIEAMQFGKPVFLSTATSLPEVGGSAAFYFSDFTEAAMQNVFEIGMQAYKTNRLSDSIKSHAQQFNWQEASRQYLAIYRSLY